jgi:hypothetical protein
MAKAKNKRAAAKSNGNGAIVEPEAIETSFADAMEEAAADGRLAAYFANPRRRKRQEQKSPRAQCTYVALSDAVREADEAQLYQGDARPRMLATILHAAEDAVYAGDLGPLTKLHQLAAKLANVNPVRFGPLEWNSFEEWLLGETRRVVAEGVTLSDLATEIRRAILVRAPEGAAHDAAILKAWDLVAARHECIDAKGRVLNDDKIVMALLTAAMRASCIDTGTRKDPFRYVKDKVGIRVSHKAKSGKRQ